MKKFMVFACAVLSSAAMQAQDIKTILGAEKYTDALELIKQGGGNLSNEDKAKAYNKVVDLALAKYNKEAEIKISNEVKNENKGFDQNGMYSAAEVALSAALDCDKYDNMPNAKGKVKPKFGKNNAARLMPLRNDLINAGQLFYDAKDYHNATVAFGSYVDTSTAPMFQTGRPDQYASQIAYFASLSAFFAKEYDKADRYADVAIADTTYAKDAMTVKLNALQNTMKSHEDTIAVTKKIENIFTQYPDNQVVFSTLTSLYLSQGRKADFNAVVDKALAQNPKNFAAIAMRGQSYMNDHKWQEAIEDLKRAVDIMPTNVPVVASIGNCYMFLAQEKAEQISAKTKGRIPVAAEKVIIDVYNQAIEYLTKAKDMDTNKEFKSNWAYSLYTCLYRTLGEDDPKTKEAEALTK